MVLAVYSSDIDTAAYLAPPIVKELTTSLADQPDNASQKSYRWTADKSLRTERGAKSQQWLRLVNNAMVHGLPQLNFGTFQGPPLLPLNAGEVRVRLGSPPRWHRVKFALQWVAKGSPVSEAELELSHELLRALMEGSLKIFLTGGDQDCSQETAKQFLRAPAPGGMGLMSDDLEDHYHRSYNDFKWAAKWSKGHLPHTILQLCQAYNANYGPYLRAANMATKRESLLQWREAAPCSDQEWLQHVDAVTLDARCAQASSPTQVQRLYEDIVLENKSFSNKGKFVKHAAWYNVIEGIEANDESFTAWRYMVRGLSRLLMARTPGAAKARKQALKKLVELNKPSIANDKNDKDTKEEHKRLLQDIRKRSGNLLLLCPALLNNFNFFNSGVLLLGTRTAWSGQTVLATHKLTPDDQMVHFANLSTGAGEAVLRAAWHMAIGYATELARLGLRIVPGTIVTNVAPEMDSDTGMLEPGVDIADIPDRLMSFVCHMTEARFWHYERYRSKWPRAFAGILSGEEEKATTSLASSKEHWEASLVGESCGDVHPGLRELRREVFWQSEPLNQAKFRLLAHFDFRRHPVVLKHLRRLFRRIGDSKLVEETNKFVRGTEELGQAQDVANQMRMYHQMTLSKTPLAHRGIPHVHASSTGAYDECQWDAPVDRPPASWSKMFGITLAQEPREWCFKNVKAKPKPFVTRTPKSARASITAGIAMRTLLYNTRTPALAAAAWQTIVLTPHTLVRFSPDGADKSQECGTMWFVLASDLYAGRLVPCRLLSTGDWGVDIDSALEWHTVTDARHWFYYPCTWRTK